MYGWLWRVIPGPALLRAFVLFVALAMIVLLLFVVVFPWAEPRLPFGHVTVDNSSAP